MGLKGASSVPDGCCSLTFIIWQKERDRERENGHTDLYHISGQILNLEGRAAKRYPLQCKKTTCSLNAFAAR